MLESDLARQVLPGELEIKKTFVGDGEAIGENGPDSEEPKESEEGEGQGALFGSKNEALSLEALARGFPVAGAEEEDTQRKREVRACRVRRAKGRQEEGLVY